MPLWGESRKEARVTNHFKTKELPESERPYEKCKEAGEQALSDAELLAVILKSGTRQQNSVELSKSILQAGARGLLNLYDLSAEELQAFDGIGEVKAIRLKCIAELSRRIAQADRRDRVCLSHPGTVADYYMEKLRHETKEQLWVAMFDAKCHLLGEKHIATGSAQMVYGSPRDIFLCALRQRAVTIILLHNHPSGEPQPSKADAALTKRVMECGELLDIALSDHIIIGDNKYYSFRENKQILV